MPKTNNQLRLTTITINIQPGPASPAQKQTWKRFWQKIISKVKANEREGRQKD